MHNSVQPESFPGLLAAHLAKLNHQLRHLLAGKPGLVAENGTDRSQSVIARLRVAASLLADPNVCRSVELAPLQRLGLVLGDLVSGLEDLSDGLPAYLLAPLRRLANYLSEVFARLDDGESPAAVCRDDRWEILLAGFINAGTVLQALDEVEEHMQAWNRRYSDQDLSSSQEDALQQRWAQLRDFGDSLFGAVGPDGERRPLVPVSAADLAGRRVMLLLDSSFRQAQLCERLRDAGCAVETASDPGGMIRRVVDRLPPEILLCDNLEPSLHLVTVRRQLQTLAANEQPILVLVAASGGTPAKLRDRARRLGARGTWAEPFWPGDLAASLS